jgi:hypothetical protein
MANIYIDIAKNLLVVQTERMSRIDTYGLRQTYDFNNMKLKLLIQKALEINDINNYYVDPQLQALYQALNYSDCSCSNCQTC